MGSLLQDAKFHLRVLARSPGFTAVAVACFALGIGANVTMFDVLDRLFFRPPPHVRDVGRIVRETFTHSRPGSAEIRSDLIPLANYDDLRTIRSFASSAAYENADLPVGRGVGAHEIHCQLATRSFFALLGVRAHIGRLPAGDGGAADAPVAVLSYGFWRREYGSDSSVVGQSLFIGGGLFTVVAVTPRGFSGVDLESIDVWLPLGGRVQPNGAGGENGPLVRVIARLRDGVSLAAAEMEARAAQRAAFTQAWGVTRVSLRRVLDRRMAGAAIHSNRDTTAALSIRISVFLGAVALMVMAIACANVAGLLLTRGLSRRREAATRMALGATRARITRFFLAESLLLALVGGAAALVVALWAQGAIAALLLPGLESAGPPGPRVAAFAAALVILSGTLVGSTAAVSTGVPDLAATLKPIMFSDTRESTVLRSALIAVQIALTVVLLVITGLFVRSLFSVRAAELGFDADRVLVISADLQSEGYDAAGVGRAFARLLDEFEKVPGISSVSLTASVPFRTGFATTVSLPGSSSPLRLQSGLPFVNGVSPGYFATLGVPLRRGRAFTPNDVAGTEKVVVVSETFARVVWPREEALGKCLAIGSDTSCAVVVGVAQDTRRMEVQEEQLPQLYLPLPQSPFAQLPTRALLARASEDGRAAIATARRILTKVMPHTPSASVQLLQDFIEPQVRPWRLGASLFAIFGAMALVLALAGVYWMVSSTIARRTHELGLRIALGASRERVLWMAITVGMRPVLLGVAAGLLVAAGSAKFLAGSLYGVQARDPATYTVVSLVVSLAAIVAAYVPAARATRIPPADALRLE